MAAVRPAPPKITPESSLEAVLLEKKDKIRFADIYGLLEKAVAEGMDFPAQLALLERLQREGMDGDEWERTADFFWIFSRDPQQTLQLAELLDSGAVKDRILNHAFAIADKSSLPRFIETLDRIQNDSRRKELLLALVTRVIDKGSVKSTLEWASTLADESARDQYSLVVLNGIQQNLSNYLNDPDMDASMIPFSEIAENYPPAQVTNIGCGYCTWYLNKGDLESVRKIIEILPRYAMGGILGQALTQAKAVSTEQAIVLKSMMPPEVPNHLSDLRDLVDKLRDTEGNEAADRFLQNQLTADQRSILAKP